MRDEGPQDLFLAVEKAIDIHSSDSDPGPIDTVHSKLAEDFEFFIQSQLSRSGEYQPTIYDCRSLYRTLKERTMILDRRESELSSRERVLAHKSADFETRMSEFMNGTTTKDSKDWKRKYLALKQKYESEKVTMAVDESIISPVTVTEEQKIPSPRKMKTKRTKKTQRVSHKPRFPRTAPKPIAMEKMGPILKKAHVAKRSPATGEQYLSSFRFNPGPIVHAEKANGRQIVRYRHGVVGTIYENGTKKVKTSSATYTFYANEDIAINFTDGAAAYRYGDTKTIDIQLPTGVRILEFSDGQKERHLVTGEKEVRFPNGKIAVIGAEVNE